MQKCLRSLETGRWGFGFDSKEPVDPTADEITRKLQHPERRAHLLARKPPSPTA